MDKHSLLQRILGGVVLISLATIFLPFFYHSDDETLLEPGGRMPPVPERIQTITFELDEDGRFKRLDEEISALGTEVKPPPEETEEWAAPAEKTKAPAEQDVAKVEPTVEKAITARDTGTPAWMVQLGSFGRKGNAVKLRDTLRASQYPAFLDERKGEKGTIWRVRVGPELDKATAERLRKELERSTGLKGLLVRHR